MIMRKYRPLRLNIAGIFYWLCALSACAFICGNVLLISPAFFTQVTNQDNPDVFIQSADPGDKNVHDILYHSRLRRLMEISADKLHPNFTFTSAAYNHLLPQMLDCADIKDLTDWKFIASGWTKAVYSANHHGRETALKIVDINGHDMTRCLQSKQLAYYECYANAAQKITKEILLLQGLAHPNIINVLGFCVPNGIKDGVAQHPVAIITELGESVDVIKLLQLSWEDRFRISLGLTKLINYFSRSPYGSLSMNDFRRQQFILVDGEIKLTDLDDVGFEEPKCEVNYDCRVHFSSTNFTLRTPCIDNRCKGFNEKKNLFNAARHFTTFLLPHGAPKPLRSMIDEIVNSYSNVTSDSEDLLEKLNKVLQFYKDGYHLNQSKSYRAKTDYVKFDRSDFPGLYDYRCRYSLSGDGCTVSVFDRREAEDICNLDQSCQGFVVSTRKTWTGRQIIHLKNGAGKVKKDINMTLYLKPGLRIDRRS